MSVFIMGLVFKADLPPNEKILLLALADHADDDGGRIFPGQALMARKTNMSDRTVRTLLVALEGRKVLVEVVPPTRHKPAHYRIDLEVLIGLTWVEESSGLKFRVEDSDSQGGRKGQVRVEAAFLPTIIEPSGEEGGVSPEGRTRVREKSPAARIKFDRGAGAITGIVPIDRVRWGELYPAVDITREIPHAAEWLLNHPERRPSNVAQFLSNWFRRAQGDSSSEPPPEPVGFKLG